MSSHARSFVFVRTACIFWGLPSECNLVRTPSGIRTCLWRMFRKLVCAFDTENVVFYLVLFPLAYTGSVKSGLTVQEFTNPNVNRRSGDLC